MEQILAPPADVSWFQVELDKITAEKAPPMRIRWAPQLTVAKVISNDGTEREYAKYPLLFGEFADYQRGVRYIRRKGNSWIVVGYQKTGDSVIPQGVRVDDLAIADLVQVNHSAHLFVIERKIANDVARQIHNEKREMALIQLGLDLFGPFPEEGVWDWYADIAEHRMEFMGTGVRVSCCEVARQNGAAFCRGLYRPPDERDLQAVRADIAFWLEKIDGHADDVNYQDRMAQELITDVFKHDRLRLIDMLHKAGEADNKRVQYEHSSRVPEMTNEQRGTHAKSSTATR